MNPGRESHRPTHGPGCSGPFSLPTSVLRQLVQQIAYFISDDFPLGVVGGVVGRAGAPGAVIELSGGHAGLCSHTSPALYHRAGQSFGSVRSRPRVAQAEPQ
jgi:hypothetical protein